MRLITIPTDKYNDYRLDVIFKGYKWDPQYYDSNTIAGHALVLTKEEHEELEELTLKLYEETAAAENALQNDPASAKKLKLPRVMRKELEKAKKYDPGRHIRLMRFDFHPVAGGWAVSEVNSDVPGGFAEASVMPAIAMKYVSPDNSGRSSTGPDSKLFRYIDFSKVFTDAITAKVSRGSRIALIHCTSYSDDRQVMQFTGDKLESMGYRVLHAAADHLRFENSRAVSVLDGNEGDIDAIIRFSPLEWVVQMKPAHKNGWPGYFTTSTCSCNHPIAVLAQTKRFPMAWDALEAKGIKLPAWKRLLPETLEVNKARGKDGFIYKPVWGRVGEQISIEEACMEDEYKKILKDVKWHPGRYLAQKRFFSVPLRDDNSTGYHICIGAFCVDGKAAGYYARMSKTARIDSAAADIPVLTEGFCDYKQGGDIPNGAPARLHAPAAGLSPGMTGREAFEIWAPRGAKWTDWARPVPFVSDKNRHTVLSAVNLSVPDISSSLIAGHCGNTAIILDLPGCESVMEGLALAKLGFRPVPLFNGTNAPAGTMEQVDNHTVASVLLWGAKEIKEGRIPELPEDAPPVFLLDSSRLHTHRMNPSVFDNSWDIYKQDMPSAGYLLSSGIRRIIVKGERISKDLKLILRGYKKKGITIIFTRQWQPDSR